MKTASDILQSATDAVKAYRQDGGHPYELVRQFKNCFADHNIVIEKEPAFRWPYINTQDKRDGTLIWMAEVISDYVRSVNNVHASTGQHHYFTSSEMQDLKRWATIKSGFYRIASDGSSMGITLLDSNSSKRNGEVWGDPIDQMIDPDTDTVDVDGKTFASIVFLLDPVRTTFTWYKLSVTICQGSKYPCFFNLYKTG